MLQEMPVMSSGGGGSDGIIAQAGTRYVFGLASGAGILGGSGDYTNPQTYQGITFDTSNVSSATFSYNASFTEDAWQRGDYGYSLDGVETFSSHAFSTTRQDRNIDLSSTKVLEFWGKANGQGNFGGSINASIIFA